MQSPAQSKLYSYKDVVARAIKNAKQSQTQQLDVPMDNTATTFKKINSSMIKPKNNVEEIPSYPVLAVPTQSTASVSFRDPTTRKITKVTKPAVVAPPVSSANKL